MLHAEKYTNYTPVQTVETIRSAPPVTEYVLRLTPEAAQALHDMMYNGKWPEITTSPYAEGKPEAGHYLNAIRVNLKNALSER